MTDDRVGQEPIVMDTGKRRFLARGIRFRRSNEPWAFYLRMGALGWIRFNHWLHAVWVARELVKAVHAVCPTTYTPIANQIEALATEMDEQARALAVIPPKTVARWSQFLKELVADVKALERNVV